MKGKLEFDLTDGKETYSFTNATKADEMRWRIDSLYDCVFREYIKYDKHPIKEGGTSLEEHELIEKLWDEVYEHFKEKE